MMWVHGLVAKSVQPRGALVLAMCLSAMCLSTTACGSAGVVDKTGGGVLELHFATIDNLDPNGQSVAPEVFIDSVERMSDGRLQVTVEDNFENGAVSAETDIVKAIADGRIDGGWPSTRAFSRAGIRGLEPVEAPFVVTSYAAEAALATGPEAATLLGTLEGSGIVGLGLSVGPLRRPFALTRPLIEVPIWRGITSRSFNSPVQEDVIRALGAEPVPASFGFPELVTSGSLEGVEMDLAQYEHSAYGDLLPDVAANVVLWPKMPVLAISRDTFDALTAEQQAWLVQAAHLAVRASVNFDYDDSSLARRLCPWGVRFVDAAPEQMAALRRAVQPVIDAMAADPSTAPSLAAVERAVAGHTEADALDVPVSCGRP